MPNLTAANFEIFDNSVRQSIAHVSLDTVPLSLMLRSRYLLTYYPQAVAREGWHNVKVTLKGARGEVTARQGYFVPPSP